MDTTDLLRVEEVALLLGCSVNTINSWYRFKASNPDNDYASMLPDFIQEIPGRSIRLWRQSDIPKLHQFKASKPVGRNGVMGEVTQKYVKRHTKEGK